MDTLVVKYDVTTFEILGAANELVEVVMLLANSSYHVELGFELGLTILARRQKTERLVFSEIKDTLFGEIQDFVKRQAARDCEKFNQWSKSNFDANFDEAGIEEWADRLDKLVK